MENETRHKLTDLFFVLRKSGAHRRVLRTGHGVRTCPGSGHRQDLPGKRFSLFWYRRREKGTSEKPGTQRGADHHRGRRCTRLARLSTEQGRGQSHGYPAWQRLPVFLLRGSREAMPWRCKASTTRDPSKIPVMTQSTGLHAYLKSVWNEAARRLASHLLPFAASERVQGDISFLRRYIAPLTSRTERDEQARGLRKAESGGEPGDPSRRSERAGDAQPRAYCWSCLATWGAAKAPS